MKDFTSHALNIAMAEGARYADIRILDHREQVVSVKNGNVDGIGDQYSQGFGIRVLVGNSWGFASSAYLEKAEIERVTHLAVKIAKASARVPGEPLDLGKPVTSVGKYSTPIQIDPFSTPLEQKLDLLFRADEIMRRNPGVKVSEGNVISVRNHKFFANTEGALVEQIIYESGGAIAATAVSETEVQIRSHPNSFRYQGTGGWECVTKTGLVWECVTAAVEAAAVVSAAPVSRTEST